MQERTGGGRRQRIALAAGSGIGERRWWPREKDSPNEAWGRETRFNPHITFNGLVSSPGLTAVVLYCAPNSSRHSLVLAQNPNLQEERL